MPLADLRMIDVTDKPPTLRHAVASAQVHLSRETVERIVSGDIPKGDVVSAVRLAGIMAAKQTPLLLPLCHQLEVTGVAVDCIPLPELGRVYVRARATALARTGVEMEALTAASVGALTVYDMCKSLDPGATLGPTRVLAKTGGRSGEWLGPSVGRILAVNISQQKGVRKTGVTEVTLKPDLGILGDAHAGPGPRQVSLLAMESIRKARDRGLDVGPGDFAENLTTQGLDLPSLIPGVGLVVGEAVGIVTQIGKECTTPCAIGRQLGQCVMPLEGIFIRVTHGGTVRPGDLLEVLL